MTIRRAFPGELSMADAFWFLDHAPDGQPRGEAEGAPGHPHHGFETITYVLDGDVAHRDTTGAAASSAKESRNG